jgi:metal-responsive CopG/Arc/MetJ family transcriptional regulator
MITIYSKRMPGGRDHRFVMRVDDDFFRRVDEWRRRQPDIPSRSEAVRRLVERGTVDLSKRD